MFFKSFVVILFHCAVQMKSNSAHTAFVTLAGTAVKVAPRKTLWRSSCSHPDHCEIFGISWETCWIPGNFGNLCTLWSNLWSPIIFIVYVAVWSSNDVWRPWSTSVEIALHISTWGKSSQNGFQLQRVWLLLQLEQIPTMMHLDYLDQLYVMCQELTAGFDVHMHEIYQGLCSLPCIYHNHHYSGILPS